MNYAAGLAHVSWLNFTWTTAVGILPIIILEVMAANQLGHGNPRGYGSWPPCSWWVWTLGRGPSALSFSHFPALRSHRMARITRRRRMSGTTIGVSRLVDTVDETKQPSGSNSSVISSSTSAYLCVHTKICFHSTSLPAQTGSWQQPDHQHPIMTRSASPADRRGAPCYVQPRHHSGFAGVSPFGSLLRIRWIRVSLRAFCVSVFTCVTAAATSLSRLRPS